MKKILIISYYFPPCNIVAAQRAKSFADNFKKFGLHPVVVTRHWTGAEHSTAGYEGANLTPAAITEHENYTLIQLPYAEQLHKPHHLLFSKTRVGKLALYSYLYAFGRINPKCNADAAFHVDLEKYLEQNPVDYILATAFPMNTIKLGSELALKFGVPFVADFRDLWDNNLLAEDYRKPPSIRIQNFFYEFYLRKWLRAARLVTTVSDALADEIARLVPQTKVDVVRNGFERDLFARLREKHSPPGNKFVFSVIGTLKPNQDLRLMLDGLKKFLTGKNLDEIELNFIGVDEFPEVKKLIEGNLPAKCTKATARIPRAEALRQMLESHVLFYAGWRGHRGIPSGKIYEYLGAHRNILIAPNDHDIIEKMILGTRSGKLADTAEEFAKVLEDWFAKWKSTGTLPYDGIESEIENYTREKQAEKLAREILTIQ